MTIKLVKFGSLYWGMSFSLFHNLDVADTTSRLCCSLSLHRSYTVQVLF